MDNPLKDALKVAGVLRGEEVAMLNHIFHELTEDPYYLGNKPAREALAADILRHFRNGMTDASTLKLMCKRTATP